MYLTIKSIRDNIVPIFELLQDDLFISLFHSLGNESLKSSEFYQRVVSDFPNYPSDSTLSPHLHTQHSRLPSDLCGVLFPLSPVLGQPTKQSSIRICETNLKRFSTIKDSSLILPMKCVFSKDEDLASWLKIPKVFKAIIDTFPNRVISLQQFLRSNYPHREKLFTHEWDKLLESGPTFLNSIVIKVKMKKTLVKFSGVIAGVDELIYRWLSTSGSNFIFPWLGEFHLIFNLAKTSFIVNIPLVP